MGRVSRAEVFEPSEVAICHVFARVVRRCFLLGNDPVTGKNYDHRKVWIEQQLWQAFGQSLLMKSVQSSVCNANDTISKMSCVPGPRSLASGPLL